MRDWGATIAADRPSLASVGESRLIGPLPVQDRRQSGTIGGESALRSSPARSVQRAGGQEAPAQHSTGCTAVDGVVLLLLLLRCLLRPPCISPCAAGVRRSDSWPLHVEIAAYGVACAPAAIYCAFSLRSREPAWPSRPNALCLAPRPSDAAAAVVVERIANHGASTRVLPLSQPQTRPRLVQRLPPGHGRPRARNRALSCPPARPPACLLLLPRRRDVLLANNGLQFLS